jgi:uncharacterized protein YqeY
MSLKERLNQDLRDAMRAGDTRRRDVLRYLLSAVHNAEIDAGRELDDAGVIAVIQRQVKQRRDSIEEYRKGGRQDLVEREEAEAAILQSYLPEQLSRDEVVEAARAAIEELGARGPADKGRVMPVLIERLRGRAEGRVINEVVTELLAQR